MSQSQARHKKKRSLASRNGEIVQITRHLADGEVVYAEGRLELDIDKDGNVGRAAVLKVKFLHACARAGAVRLFLAALDAPVPGYAEWFRISGHYVLMNQHTQGRTFTAAVMSLR